MIHLVRVTLKQSLQQVKPTLRPTASVSGSFVITQYSDSRLLEPLSTRRGLPIHSRRVSVSFRSYRMMVVPQRGTSVPGPHCQSRTSIDTLHHQAGLISPLALRYQELPQNTVKNRHRREQSQTVPILDGVLCQFQRF